MRHIALTAALAVLLALPARADDVEDSIEAALQAYRAGDIKTARDELDFAGQLLDQMKAEGLRAFLPEPLPGWEREIEETEAQPLAMIGGGQMASAAYRSDDDELEIELMADNQMVTAMAAMFSNAAMMGSMGRVRRIEGEKVVITPEGDLQALIDGRIMVQISGPADADTKAAYFEAMDIEGLSAF